MPERMRKLHAEMAARGIDLLALRCTPNYTYAGATGPCLVSADSDELAAYDALRDLAAGDVVVAADDLPPPLFDVPAVDAEDVIAAAKLCKTPGEIARIRRAQQINEDALRDVVPEPGTHQDELTEHFLKRILELGASENLVEPIWQVADRAQPLLFPLVGQNLRLRAGDLVVVDTGISFEGYASDYGRTWGARREHFDAWRDVMDAVLAAIRPGATGLDLVRAAGHWNGRKPWLDHLYLAHGTGTASAEMPLIGTDRGEAFDESIVLAPGMVLVLEPVIWTAGEGGYRAEETVAVTDDGYEMLSESVTW